MILGGFFAPDLLGGTHVGDLFYDLYRPRSSRYGDDIEPEPTGDPLPDRHGLRYQWATGCACGVCVAACRRHQAQSDDGRARDRARPWDRNGDVEPALTYDEWKAARSA